MITAPWDDDVVVSAAVDLAGIVRDDLEEAVDTLAQIPAADLVRLVITTAAMVDVDQPISALRRWEREGFLGQRSRIPDCGRGHPMTGDNLVLNGQTPAGRQRFRCRACANDRYRRRRAA